MAAPRRARAWAILLLSLVLDASATLARAAWRSETVEHGGEAGRTSIRWDPASRRFGVAIGGETLRFALEDGAGWSLEIVDPTVCVGFVSLAFDPDGEPLIAYQDTLHEQLRFARRDSTGWHTEIVDPGPETGNYASLALDPAGAPAIAYLDRGAEDLRLARRNGGAWAIEVVDAAGRVGSGAALVFDRAGLPALSYLDADRATVKLARWSGSAWSFEGAVAGCGAPTALAFDLAGNPAIACPGPADDLWFAIRNGAGWQVEVALTPAWGSGERALLFDSAGIATLVYPVLMDQSRVRIGRRVGGSWRVEEVSQPAGGPPSLALDDLDRPAVSCTRLDSVLSPEPVGVEIDRHTGAGWTSNLMLAASRYEERPALAFGPGGEPAVAWADWSRLELRFAARSSGAWATETVAPASKYVARPSLTLDATGVPFVAWYSQNDGGLRAARRPAAAWLETIVDADGGLPRMARGRNGEISLAWQASAAWEIRRASWLGSTWRVETVATARGNSPVGHAFHADGRPCIAFHDQDAGAIRLATLDGSVWSTEEVAAAAGVSSLQLAVDPAGAPAVAWEDSALRQTFLARRTGLAWSRETVTAADAISVDLVFDPAGTPLVGWATSAGPRLSRLDAATWVEESIDRSCRGSAVGLALAPSGAPAVAYVAGCRGELRYAERLSVTLFRGVVADLDPAGAWKAAALPLDSTRDDATPPFPVLADAADDSLPAAGDLVLYRALGPADVALGNGLRVVPGAAIALLYLP